MAYTQLDLTGTPGRVRSYASKPGNPAVAIGQLVVLSATNAVRIKTSIAVGQLAVKQLIRSGAAQIDGIRIKTRDAIATVVISATVVTNSFKGQPAYAQLVIGATVDGVRIRERVAFSEIVLLSVVQATRLKIQTGFGVVQVTAPTLSVVRLLTRTVSAQVRASSFVTAYKVSSARRRIFLVS